MQATTVPDILRWVTERSGRPLGGEEGVTYGLARRPVSGVTVCWMPDVPAIRAAAKAGHQLLIHHEDLTFPLPFGSSTSDRKFLSWPINLGRLGALAEAGLTACRLHFSADLLCVYPHFAKVLALGKPVAGRGPFGYVYEIRPTPYGRLIQRVKKAVNMPSVRTTCVKGWNRIIRRVGMPWGGLGLVPNLSYMESLVELGVDVMIGGESDSFGMRFCAEVGVDFIETSHELSEIPGLEQFAGMLKRRFPRMDIRLFGQDCVWQIK